MLNRFALVRVGCYLMLNETLALRSKWTYSGDKLVKEVLERKGPKKPVREIQLHVPNRKVGLIIGKGGVNIKIIEAKSAAKVKIFKPAPGDQVRRLRFRFPTPKLSRIRFRVQGSGRGHAPGGPQILKKSVQCSAVS